MANYVLTNSAVNDLSEIWNYTFEMWSEKQADKFYLLIIETFKELSKSPAIGKNYTEISSEILGFGIGKHIIFYRQIKSNEIEVIRILHGRMDLKMRL